MMSAPEAAPTAPEPYVHVYRPAVFTARRILFCPTCDRRRRFVVSSFIWFDPTAQCCACGETWHGSERAARPFARGWRTEAIRNAQQRWATAMSRTEADAAFRAAVDDYVNDTTNI